MKNILALLIVSTLIGCTKSGSNNETPKAPVDTDQVVSIKDGLKVGNVISADAPELLEDIQNSTFEMDFGQISPYQSLIKKIKVRNETTSTKTITIEGVTPPFQVFLNRCTQPLLPNNSCELSFRMIANPQILNGPISPVEISLRYGVATEDKLALLFKAEMINSAASASEWTVEAKMNESFNSSAFILGQSLGYRYVKIKNKGLTSADMNDLFPEVNNEYSILLNRCQGMLMPSQECSIVLFYSQFRVKAPEEESSVFSYSKNEAGERSGFNVLTKVEEAPQITSYIPTFGDYDLNLVTDNCSGTQVASRQITQCARSYDMASVDVSNCTDPNPFLVYESPAGNQSFAITAGSELFNCPLGKDKNAPESSLVSRTCDFGFYDTGMACSQINYIASYSSYTPEIPSNLQICDGTVISERTMTCTQQHDNLVVSNIFCPVDLNAIVVTESPAGIKNVSISNGNEDRSCQLGDSLAESTLSLRTCDMGYHDNGTGCDFTTYTASYSNYSPAIPSSLDVCDGTVVSNRTMTCTRDHDSAVVSNSFCPADTSATVTTLSPAGDEIEALSFGSRTINCAEGSSTKTFVSSSCDGGYFYSPASSVTGVCHLPLNVTSDCNGIYEGDNCQVTATNGVPPYTYSLDNTTGGASISASGLLSPSSYGSTSVTVTDSASNQFILPITGIQRLHASCNAIKTENPANVTNGFYTIDGDGLRTGEGKFQAYCDMVNNGGGWTLLFTGNMLSNPLSYSSYVAGPMPNYSNPLYNGTSTATHTFTILGGTVTLGTQQLQAVNRTVKFQDLRYYGYVLRSSVSNTTFAQKHTNVTPWTSGVAAHSLAACPDTRWNILLNGSITRTMAVFGCSTGGCGYGDCQVVGLGTVGRYNGGAGYTNQCGSGAVSTGYDAIHILGTAFHRGACAYSSDAVQSSINNQMWIK